MSQPKLKHHLSTLDATFLYYEKEEAPFHVGSTMIFDGEISFEEFTNMLSGKLSLLPRYMQKVVPAPFNIGHPSWEFDPDFDIKKHIFSLQLDSPGTVEQLRELSCRLQRKMLDRSKPLWEIYVVNGLEGNRSALISKLHHSMADGIASVELMNISFDQSPTPPPTSKPKAIVPPRRPTFDPVGRWIDSVLDEAEEVNRNWNELRQGLLSLGLELLKKPGSPISNPNLNPVVTLVKPVSMFPFNQPNSGQLEISWNKFSFSEAHAIGKALGGTVNDVMLAAVSGAVSRYLEQHEQKTTETYLRFFVPVNVRNETQNGLGNKISALPVEVPMQLKDPSERLAFIVKETKEMKDARVPDQFSLLLNLVGILPVPLQAVTGSVMFTPVPLVNMVCTNVPGPHTPLYILGKKLVESYPYVPFAYAVGLTCTIFSYDNQLFVTLSSDAKKMPSIGQEFMLNLDQAFAELREIAGVSKTKAHRVKTPAE